MRSFIKNIFGTIWVLRSVEDTEEGLVNKALLCQDQQLCTKACGGRAKAFALERVSKIFQGSWEDISMGNME